jgi:methionine biosynthesis protein MetW
MWTMNEHYSKSKGLHLNYELITKMVEGDSHILDLGCGDGELLQLLKDKKNAKCLGIDINQDNVISCLKKGLSVIQGNIDEGLKQFADKTYDCVILNRTLQSTNKPDYVLEEMLRVGKKCIVSFPNFAYWRVRFYYFFKGHMPKSKVLPFEWYDTPNIHLLTIKDFFEFCEKRNIKILDSLYTTKAKKKRFLQFNLFSNLLAEEAIFVISKD